MSKELSELEINEVKERAREKLGTCRKINDIIGTQVFSILGQYARVIYYPFGEDAPWGFTRLSGTQNDAGLERPFVAINTSIPTASQVFAAAHELYHIWYEQAPDFIPPNLLEEEEKEVNEKKANRFAAEFLIDELLLRQEIDTHHIRHITVKDVLLLSDIFTVPYHAMVKRLHEIRLIGATERKTLLAETDASILRFRRLYAFSLGLADKRIAVDNLAELSVKAYDAGLVTYEKLESLLRICDLTPEDVGIAPPTENEYPSDEELDRIMEEDG
ncbi:MAG: ImmA/IrrE family metallo-endopeptidase [Lachnospiraceae bacterium]|nr:ImmA/IrrE family metallo-endopeptidase [Lachnospiraceae bacterium]